MDLKELTLVNPETNWYYQAKLTAITSLIGKYDIKFKEVVDVGAGSGFFGKSVVSQYVNSHLTCVDTNYEKEFEESSKVKYRKSSTGVIGELYLFIDVLEHVDDDFGLVREYMNNAREGAAMIITVPAFMGLWSGHDVFLEHKKRYRKEELITLSNKLGFEILESGYLFSMIFPIAYLERKLFKPKSNQSSMREFNTTINLLLKTLTKLEHTFFRNSKFGLSTYLVARK